MTFILLPIAVLVAFLISLYSCPIAADAASKYGIVDKPDGKLKIHRKPVPYFGGLAVFASFLLAISFVYDVDRRMLAILLSGSIVVLLGLIDDFQVLSPWAKFIGQMIAAYVLIDSDIYIKIDILPVWVSVPLTVVWLVGMMNAVNIIDIMDGLATGVAAIAGTSFLIIALINDDTMIIALTAVLIGSTLGFLRYNFPPARIYLGDSGSMFLGLILGALSITGDYTSYNQYGYLSPLIILSIPVFDTGYVVLMRTLKGKSPFLGSKDHFAVRLRIAGFPTHRIVLSTYAVGILMGGLAILNMYLKPLHSFILLGSAVLFYFVSALLLSGIKTKD